jgi:hypothetical protein
VGYDEKTRKKMEKEEEAIKAGARVLEKREKQAGKLKAKEAGRRDTFFLSVCDLKLRRCAIARRFRTRPLSFGRRGTHPRRSRRFVEIKAKLRNSRNG